eukprot:scaffold8630_cov156-Amphora_coffeaeformis.AAC.1
MFPLSLIVRDAYAPADGWPSTTSEHPDVSLSSEPTLTIFIMSNAKRHRCHVWKIEVTFAKGLRCCFSNFHNEWPAVEDNRNGMRMLFHTYRMKELLRVAQSDSPFVDVVGKEWEDTRPII